MKLTFYLFNETVMDFQQALLAQKFSGENAFEKMTPAQDLPFDAEAYFQKNKSSPPKWLSYIAGYFDLDASEIQNQTNSFLLLVRTKGRIFAVTTGFGGNAIDRSKIENGFGLKVTLNEIDPKKIKGIDVRKIDTTTKQKRVLINKDSPLFDFDFDLDEDLLNLISGQPRDSSLASKLVGADSLSVTTDMVFDEIGSKCDALLSAFSKDDYKTNFSFIDHLRVVKDTTLKNSLDEILVDALTLRETEKILLAYPEIDNWSQVEALKLMYRYKSDVVGEADLSAIYQFLAKEGFIDVDPFSFHIIGLDHDEMAVTKKFSLYDYVVFETALSGKRYILSLGRWFEIADEYVQQVDLDISSIEEITISGFLPPMRKGQREDNYNALAATAKGLVLLDKINFPAGGPSKIEVCDLLSADKEFICVKKYNGSSTLSHLFSQGYVSSALFDDWKEYRQFISSKCSSKWPRLFNIDNPEKTEITFIFAIASETSGRLVDSLPFFSKVNLRQARKAIQKLGFKVKLYRIPLS